MIKSWFLYLTKSTLVMNSEISKVKALLKNSFQSASNIYVDTFNKECEVSVSIDEYQGVINDFIVDSNVRLQMIDYSDIYPFKYVFYYKIKNNKKNKNIVPFNVKCLL